MIIPKKTSYAKEKLDRDFFAERVKAMSGARALGHSPKWTLDSATEGAIHCPKCNLWGRVVLMAGRAQQRKDVGGRVLSVKCSPNAVHTSEPELHWDFGIGMIEVSSIFRGVGYEPRTPSRKELFPERLRIKQHNERSWNWNGRKRK